MGGEKVALVVDDSDSMRQMVSFTLRSAGFTVVEGADGAEGLEQLERHQVRLIITDLNMPGMDGFTFIRRARARVDCRFTPILMLTTEADDVKKREGKAAGATGWVVKPFDPERLLKTVSRVVA